MMIHKRRTVAAGELKQRCAEVLDEVNEGKDAVVTKRGRAIARVEPPAKRRALTQEEALARLKEMIIFIGDIEPPLDEPWEADA